MTFYNYLQKEGFRLQPRLDRDGFSVHRIDFDHTSKQKIGYKLSDSYIVGMYLEFTDPSFTKKIMSVLQWDKERENSQHPTNGYKVRLFHKLSQIANKIKLWKVRNFL